MNNLELRRGADATRSSHLNDEEEKKLLALIQQYKSEGSDAWQLGAPCSSFSRNVWETATGENLNSNYGFISNPTTLKNSIIRANGGINNSTMTTSNGGSSASSGSLGRSSGSSLNSSGSSL